uniref:50S ribosomal protein L14 n=1 Tax=Spongospora subterranea TaxID=70186 RepID=A0A096XTX4_9EUKA|nr:50S ribosomal protein L14 [Spongospora subterranea]AIK19931.1 50S ribosomal protein L14 [Spongospora subterranea]
MLYKQTKLKIIDNSGAKLIKIFHNIGYSSPQNYSKIGDLVLGSILKYKANKKIVKKQLCKALIIASKKGLHRKNGNFIKFDENRGILVTDSKKLLGTRIFGPVSKEIRRGTYSRLLSITKKIV